MKNLILILSGVYLYGCSGVQVRSTVDSFGEDQTSRNGPIYFDLKDRELLDQQAAKDCSLAAKEMKVEVSATPCATCSVIELKTRLTGTEQILRSGPGYGGAWGIFGGSSGVGVGLNSGSIQSSREAGREINLTFYPDSAKKKKVREIQIRSVGRENSVSAVAYEMCKAAFKDYPQDLKGKFYEIDYHKEEKAKD